MKKLIKGTLILDENIEDRLEYTKKKIDIINKAVSWADEITSSNQDTNIDLSVGFTDDDSIVAQYAIKAKTYKVCNANLSELNKILRTAFPKKKSLIQIKGECFR